MFNKLQSSKFYGLKSLYTIQSRPSHIIHYCQHALTDLNRKWCNVSNSRPDHNVKLEASSVNTPSASM